MPKTARGECLDERINTLVSVQAKRSLERLAAGYGVTQRTMLERLLREAELAALHTAARLPGGSDGYLEGQVRLS